MKKYTYIALVLIGLISPNLVPAQDVSSFDTFVWKHLSPGPFAVGYKVNHSYDTSRSMDVLSDTCSSNGQKEISRPLQVSIWYPATPTNSDQSVERIDYFLTTLTQFDFDAFKDSNRDDLIAEFRLRSSNMNEQQFLSLAHEKMHAYKEATPAPGQFPLILYGTGGGSEPWENSILFEYLASQGYVVATSPSFGTFSFDMEDNSRGLETKVRDMGFVLATMLKEPFVNSEKIAAVGWSWGGLGSILLAMRDPRIDAVVSLDGSIAYEGGRRSAADNPFFDWRRMRVPFLHFSQSGSIADLSFFELARYSERTLFTTKQMIHSDFAWGHSAHAAVLRNDTARLGQKAEAFAAVSEATRQFLDLHLKGMDTRVELPENIADKSISSAVQPPPLPEEFSAILRKDGVASALDAFNAARVADPEARPFSEADMFEYAQKLDARGMSSDAISLLDMILVAFPDSWLAQANLASIYSRKGNKEAAEKHRTQCETIINRLDEDRKERASKDLPYIESLTGNYGEGIQSVIIAVRNGELIAAGTPAFKLIHSDGTTFNVENRQGISIRFVLNGESCEGMIVRTPGGEMALAKR